MSQKREKGYYGLDLRYGRRNDYDHPMDDSGSSSMDESVRSKTELSGREKRKSLDDFRSAASDAKKRQDDKETKDNQQ